MKQIEKIKVLVSMLEENVEMLEENVEMLESYPEKEKEWENRRDEYKEKHGDKYYIYCEPYPVLGTSKSHIRDIAKLIRKELLKI